MRRPECDIRDFVALDIRVARIVAAEPFVGAHKPAMVLHLDCGKDWGVLKTSAQIAQRYTPSDLIGKQVLAVVNLPPKQIGPIQSQCLVLGALDQELGTTLIQPEHPCPEGTQIA